jgi:hypothetical protein
MTGGFDEWAVARTPSLLAFASAVTQDPDAADAAVTRALARMRPVWDRVLRDDPDLEVRRQVVRACARPRRAAVVLRVLEERTDAEIAEILDCSESAARRHVQRGLAEAGRWRQQASVTSAHDHVVAHAGSGATQLLTRPPVTQAIETSLRRRRGTWAAAFAVVALVGGVAFISHETRTPAGEISYGHVDVPASWRYESYAGVQVRVPATWGWGSSPVTSEYFAGPRHLGACGSNEAYVLSPSDDSPYVSARTGFVGRPSITDDRCVPWGSDGSTPVGDAMWFQSPMAVGVEPVGGTVAETRLVGHQHVTVFSLHQRLRRQILGSAELVDVDAHGCPTRPVTRATAGPVGLDPTSMSVCLYSQDTGVSTLMWSGSVPAREAQAYAVALDAATGDAADDECSPPTGRWVALGLHGDGGTRWDVVNLGCVRVQRAGGLSGSVTPATVLPWAYGGVTAYVSTPRTARRLEPYFQAPAR